MIPVVYLHITCYSAFETNYIWHQETHRIYINYREFYQCHLQAATYLDGSAYEIFLSSFNYCDYISTSERHNYKAIPSKHET